ncbi:MULTISPECIES: winged helix-turn-helix domain-containing protein [unclassified Amycolatopsis]|uniref:winged helix-turn-helix domain-containing protein n=1 Tax=unclassified Amycolatopsis TaxID=2618356 RepID=UPI00287558DF|nr:winged helix-turn-helix domain-containing protein [Amycolatopsis sp. 505]MDS0146042.1 winged helix-turn-helix domain-containing protein [Amycolatopsis sp. CM201R]
MLYAAHARPPAIRNASPHSDWAPALPTTRPTPATATGIPVSRSGETPRGRTRPASGSGTRPRSASRPQPRPGRLGTALLTLQEDAKQTNKELARRLHIAQSTCGCGRPTGPSSNPSGPSSSTG